MAMLPAITDPKQALSALMEDSVLLAERRGGALHPRLEAQCTVARDCGRDGRLRDEPSLASSWRVTTTAIVRRASIATGRGNASGKAAESKAWKGGYNEAGLGEHLALNYVSVR